MKSQFEALHLHSLYLPTLLPYARVTPASNTCSSPARKCQLLRLFSSAQKRIMIFRRSLGQSQLWLDDSAALCICFVMWPANSPGATWAQHKYKRICLCLCLWSGVLPCLWVHLSSSEKQTFKKYVRLNQCKKKKKTLRVNGSTFPVKNTGDEVVFGEIQTGTWKLWKFSDIFGYGRAIFENPAE